MKKITSQLICVSIFIFGACSEASDNSAPNLDNISLHQSLLTLDTHVDIPLNYMTDAMDPSTDTDAQVDFGKMKAGGLDAAFFIVYTPQTLIKDAKYEEARKIAETRFAAIKKMTEVYGGQIELAKTAADVRRIAASGKRVALIGMENAFPLGPTVEDVPMWAERGVRYMGITHMGHNQFGDSSNPKAQWDEEATPNGGLTPLGRDLIVAMNKAGIMVDVSHAGRETMMQATALSKVPVIASHSGVMAVAKSARNLDDEQLRALAKNGGVVQLVALGSYVKALTPAQEKFKMDLRVQMGLETDKKLYGMDDATEAKYMEAIKPMFDMETPASVSDYADHIDHAVKIAGIDHVGIASDFDGGGGIVGWQDASETKNITYELVKRGYSEGDIAKIWGGNLLRVLEAVQAGSGT